MMSLSSFYLQKDKKKMEFTNSKILKDMLKKGLLIYMMLDLINRRTKCCVILNFSSSPLVHACLELTISGSVWGHF